MTKRPIVFYAFGSGAGHLARTTAIARKVRTAFQGDIIILSNSPFSCFFDDEACSIIYVAAEKHDRRAVTEHIQGLITHLHPLVLAVDTFPSGLGGELLMILEHGRFRKVLIRRIIRKGSRDCDDSDRFISLHYDAVIEAELSPAPPILIRDFEELPGRDCARKKLSVHGSGKLIIAAGSGDPAWQRDFFSLVRKVLRRTGSCGYDLRCASLLPVEGADISTFPLIDVLPGADIAIGASGYNFFHESQSLSIPSIYIPVRQKYDDQERRAGADAVRSPEELQARLAVLLAERNLNEPTAYTNGARRAAHEILSLL